MKTDTATERAARLCPLETIPESRLPTLEAASAFGCSDESFIRLCEANRTSREETIVLPRHRYEGLSRGRGWARSGRGDNVIWGERVDGGYRVGPGRWSVGATDGFSRKDATTWDVAHIAVGPETWTVAS